MVDVNPDANWYRSWPNPEPHYGPRVIDHLTRLYMHDHDYNTVIPWPNSDVFLLEWDMALDSHSRRLFEKAVALAPHQVFTAGYWLNGDRWLAHGFGCVYLPRQVVRHFRRDRNDILSLWTDVTFFNWYGHENVNVCHNIYPQHLNS